MHLQLSDFHRQCYFSMLFDYSKLKEHISKVRNRGFILLPVLSRVSNPGNILVRGGVYGRERRKGGVWYSLPKVGELGACPTWAT